jgi:hypothetical protein
MIDREEMIEEMKLRQQVRKVIGIVMERRQNRKAQQQLQEQELRGIIRSLLQEKNAVANTAIHSSTGINSLEDLLKNTNLLSVLSKGYRSLTTRTKDDPPTGQTKQRLSYQNHILNAVETSLAPEESRKESGENIEAAEIEIDEAIDIDIGDVDKSGASDDPDFIDVEEKEVKSDGEIEKEEFAISGQDKTGRNKAFTDFKNVEKNILTAYDDLDDPQDREMFENYLLKNLHLYFEKWEDEIPGDIKPPAEAEEATADEPEGLGDEELGGEEELALQEALKYIDLENLVECLK